MAAPPLAAQVQPDLNVSEELRLSERQGRVKNDDQLDAERTSAIVKGVESGINNFYGIQEKATNLGIRKEALESNQMKNELDSMELERQYATEAAQLETAKLKAAQGLANASMAKDIAENSKEAYSLSVDPDPMKRLELYTNPKYDEFLSSNKEFAETNANKLYNQYPQFKKTLEDSYFRKLDLKAQRNAAIGSLKERDKEVNKVEGFYDSTDSIVHIDRDALKDAKIISGPNGPDLILPDGRKFSSTIAQDLAPAGRSNAISAAIKYNRGINTALTKKEKALAIASGISPEEYERQKEDKNKPSQADVAKELTRIMNSPSSTEATKQAAKEKLANITGSTPQEAAPTPAKAVADEQKLNSAGLTDAQKDIVKKIAPQLPKKVNGVIVKNVDELIQLVKKG